MNDPMEAQPERAQLGRWPTWVALASRRKKDCVYELARWRRVSAERYCVLTWSLVEVSVRWRSFRTLREARAHHRALNR